MAHHVEGRRVARVATNGFAVASMVLGIVWAMGVGSILAVIFGFIAKNQIDASDGAESGRGMAIAGIVLGLVGVAFLIVGVVMMALGWMSMPSMDGMMTGDHGH